MPSPTPARSKTQAGTWFSITKTFAATAISSTGTDLTSAASGRFQIQDIIVGTDAVALTSNASLLQVSTNNAYGSAVVFGHAGSSLGANVTMNLDLATTKIRAVLEDGKKLTIKESTTDLASTGNVNVTVVLRRLTDGASITAA